MKSILVTGLIALLAACASTGVPELPPGGELLFQPAPSVYAVLGERERLDLSSEQIASLDSIGRWLIETNSPLNQELRELGVISAPTGLAAQRRVIPREALPILERIGENNREAAESVGEVLTEAQRTLVCETRERAGRREGTPRAERRRSQRGMSIDSAGVARMRPGGWPWCPPAGSPS